jgi:hypothetical protein
MRRREFITLLTGAVVAWPLAAHAQQPAMPVIVYLIPTSPDANPERLRAFHQGLKDNRCDNRLAITGGHFVRQKQHAAYDRLWSAAFGGHAVCRAD